MKKLRRDLLLSAIIATEQRRDKALRVLIQQQTKLDDLHRRAARLAKRAAKEHDEAAKQPPVSHWETLPLDQATQVSLVTQPQMADDTDPLNIPDFLKRANKSVDDRIKVAADQIRAEQAERKRTKARARIEKLKAKQRGDTRKMPLRGKAALKYIKEGA